MSRLGGGLAACVAIAVLGASAPARADSRAEAVVLFDQGIKDMKAGKLDKACAELQASLELVRDSGTKGALARCQGLSGKIATAWLLWRELADTAPSAELRSDAAAQAAKLEPRLPRYTIKLAAPMPNLVVQINGRTVAASVEVPVPIDPGKLTVTAVRKDGERESSPPFRHEYVAVERQTLLIELPVLEETAAPVAKLEPSRPVVDDDALARRHRRHVIAAVVGGVAIAAGATGGYFALAASSKYDDAKATCGGAIDRCPSGQLAASQKQVDDARSAATVATGLAIGAGAAAVAAVVLWVTAPSVEPRGVAIAPSVGARSVGVVLGGSF